MEAAERMAKATFSDWFHMMKPGVLALLQITAMCTILIHDLIEWNAHNLFCVILNFKDHS